jgi:two-component system, chemotaxis family, sensor kinase CheA
VDVGGEPYVLPLESVVECIPAPAGLSEQGRASGMMPYRSGFLTYLRLSSFWETGQSDGIEEVVVVRQEESLAGLVVDGLRGEVQATAQPINGPIEHAKGVSGACILQNGSLALLIDLGATVRSLRLCEEDAASSELRARKTSRTRAGRASR